jgi:Tfp pilus assembly protein PilX
MKIELSRGDQGSALIISLMLSGMIAITLISYLTMISGQHKSVARTEAWNAAMAMAEAGVEEAMEQLEAAGSTNSASLSTNSWTLGGDGMYHKTRTLTNNSYSGFAGVAIQPAASPVIWSTGFVLAPFSTSGAYIGRLVKVIATNSVSSGNGITVKGTILFNSGSMAGVTRTNGAYDLATSDLIGAAALSNTNSAGAINLQGGGSHILGSTYTGPGGTVTVSGGAGVGNTLTYSGIQAGHTNNNANYQFNDITAAMATAAVSGYLSSFTVTGGTNYAGTAGLSTAYQMTQFTTGNSTQPLIVNGNVTVYFTAPGSTGTGGNSLTVQGSGYIKVMPGAKLTIYTAGNVTISGGGVVNGTGLADNTTIYGLPTATAVTYSGSANYIGTVNAPEALFTLSGGANVIGAILANSAVINSGTVYWDSGLNSNPAFLTKNWNEVALH